MRSTAAVAAALSIVVAVASPAQSARSLILEGSVPLPGVEGRIDHMDIDLEGNRLFVAGVGDGTVEVVDLSRSRMIRRLTGFSEPQGIAFVPETRKLYITNGGTGACDVLDARSLDRLSSIDFGEDADNIHYDPAAGRLLISAGNGIHVLSAVDDTRAGNISLPGHPEGFVLEKKGPLMYVNVPRPGRSMFVIDRRRSAVVDSWRVGGPLANFFSNFPVALDEPDGLLFTATRFPAMLITMSASTGRTVQSIGCDGDADDVFYDAERHRVYVSCGSGFVDVFETTGSGLGTVDRIPTAAGARTSLWAAPTHTLFVAAPARGKQEAKILVYRAY